MDGARGSEGRDAAEPESEAEWLERLYALNPWARGLDIGSDAFEVARQNACVNRWIEGAEIWNTWAAAMRTLRLDIEKQTSLYDAIAFSDFSELCFRNGANFEKLKFPGAASFRKTQFGERNKSPGRISFRRTKFSGGHANFSQARFCGGNSHFTQATFGGGDAWFVGAKFSGGKCSFRDVKFSGGRAWFVGATFSGGEVLFANTKFSGGDSSFDMVEFSGGRTSFNDARFCGGNASFCKSSFSGGEASFRKTSFCGGAASFNKASFCGGETSFTKATFSGGDARFNEATFSGGDARFGGAKFSGGSASFLKAIFSGHARFGECTFSGGDARFVAATFHNIAYFSNVRFMSTERSVTAQFDQANFYSLALFDGAKFDIADFRSIKCAGAFTIHATFSSTPDFRQASFSEAPLLDDVEISPSLTRRFVEGDRRCELLDWAKHAPGKREHAKFRALRGMAEQGNDHVSALRFNADEIAARRFWVDEPVGRNASRFWLGWLYQFVSDYGRSILRPLIGLFAVVATFAALFYAGAQPDDPKTPWTRECHQSVNREELKLQPTDKVTEAISLSIRNALIFDRSDTSRRTYGCLYGLVDNGRSGAIPTWVGKLSLLESLLSAIFLFLIGLALRNMFRLG